MYKILVVDDEALARETVINRLIKFGYENIYEAEDGIEAYEKINQLSPQIVIADIRMPGMDGIELLSKIQCKTDEIIFIFVSGYELFEYAQKALSLGAFNYLLKPISDDDFSTVMENACRRLSQKGKEQNMNYQAKIRMTQGNPVTIIPFKTEQELLSCFEKGDILSATKIVNCLYYSFENDRTFDPDSSATMNLQVILLIYKIFMQLNIKPEKILGDEFLLYNQIQSLQSIEDKMKWFEEKLNICFDSVNIAREKSSKKTVDRAKEYINDNIEKNITLEIVADYVHLSPNYFSKIFKQEERQNFVDYIINYRISKAKELLKQGIYRTNKVCKMVGFISEKHFHRSFKKLTGLTPGEYKEI